MKRVALPFLLAATLLTPLAFAADEPKPVPVKRVLAHVLPDKADLVWTRIPWRATLWDAVIDAHEQKKPILLWAMNGHALACT